MRCRRLLAHPFVADNFWYGLASTLVNVLNYGYFLLALRYLDKDEFGAFNALVAMLTLATIVANPLLLHVTREVARRGGWALGEYGRATGLRLLVPGLAGLLCVGAASGPLSAALSVPRGLLILGGAAVVSMLLATLATGITSGLKRFRFQAFLNLGATAAKFLLAWFLFALGWGGSAGLAGYSTGFLLTLAVTWRMLRAWETAAPGAVAGGEGGHSLWVLVLAYLGVAGPFSLDQVLAQALNPALGGDYAALATVGKLAFFVSSPFQIVAYSYLARTGGDRGGQMRYLWAGAGLAVGTSLLFTLGLGVGGRTVTSLILSPRYGDVAPSVVPYCLGMCGYVFAYLVVSLAIARSDSRIVPLIWGAALAQAGLFAARHETLRQMLVNQIVCFALLAAAAAVYLLLPWPRRRGAADGSPEARSPR